VRIDGELMEIWPNEVCDRSFGLAYCLDKVAGTGEGKLTEGGDTGIRGGATVGAGAGLVMS